MMAAITTLWSCITVNMPMGIQFSPMPPQGKHYFEFLGDGTVEHPPSDEGRMFLQAFSKFFLGKVWSLLLN